MNRVTVCAEAYFSNQIANGIVERPAMKERREKVDMWVSSVVKFLLRGNCHGHCQEARSYYRTACLRCDFGSRVVEADVNDGAECCQYIQRSCCIESQRAQPIGVLCVLDSFGCAVNSTRPIVTFEDVAGVPVGVKET